MPSILHSPGPKIIYNVLIKRKSSGCTKCKDGQKQIGFPSWQGDLFCGQNKMSCDGRVGKILRHHLCNCLESGGTRCTGSLQVHAELEAGRKWEQRVGKRKGEHCILSLGAVIVVLGRRER